MPAQILRRRMENAQLVRRSLAIPPVGREYTVVASLPKNNVQFAAMAQEAGADALIMNIDGDGSSRPNHLGSYDLHDTFINDIVSTVSVPCGIFVGGARAVTAEYWERIMSSDLSFVEMYAHQMPLFVLSDTRVRKIVAVAAGYMLEQVKRLSLIEGVAALDSATVSAQARGAPFSALDLATLGLIVGLAAKPVLLRTQKRMTRADAQAVLRLGVKGLVVDPAVLTGSEETYRDEMANLCPGRQNPGQQ